MSFKSHYIPYQSISISCSYKSHSLIVFPIILLTQLTLKFTVMSTASGPTSWSQMEGRMAPQNASFIVVTIDDVVPSLVTI